MTDILPKGDFIPINGENISVHEAAEIIRMFRNDAKQIAGLFHNMNRSDKFRANWPNEYTFADMEWKNFIEATRQMYVEQLADPTVSQYKKRRMHLAIVLWSMCEQGSMKDPRIQLTLDTQQFAGDKFENKKIIENFGRQSNTFKELMLGTAKFH